VATLIRPPCYRIAATVVPGVLATGDTHHWVPESTVTAPLFRAKHLVWSWTAANCGTTMIPVSENAPLVWLSSTQVVENPSNVSPCPVFVAVTSQVPPLVPDWL
jgi:hypothetical protein